MDMQHGPQIVYNRRAYGYMQRITKLRAAILMVYPVSNYSNKLY